MMLFDAGKEGVEVRTKLHETSLGLTTTAFEPAEGDEKVYRKIRFILHGRFSGVSEGLIELRTRVIPLSRVFPMSSTT